jgi:hypothetical protein
MTDLQQAHSKPISLKTITIALLATSILGSLVAIAAWALVLPTSQAIAIVSIGREDQNAPIEEPQAVIERIKSPDFAAAASTRAGISELSQLLLAVQYGGDGALSARNLRDPNLIEIRINLPQRELAQKGMNAVVDELIANHAEKIASRIKDIQSTLVVLDRRESELIKSSDTITKNIGSNGETSQDNTGLLNARAFTETGLISVVKNEIDLRSLLSFIRATRVIMTPTVLTPRTSSLYRVVAAGALAGLLVGLLALQMFPRFFRI